MAYYSIEPFGEGRQDFRIAQLSMIMHNAWSKRKLRLQDFIPSCDPPKEQSMEEMKSALKAIVLARGGKIGSKRN